MNVLVAVATGFVGSHPILALLASGNRVHCLSRNADGASTRLRAAAEIVRGDVHDTASLAAAFDGMDAAYYLVHSMENSEFDFEERDRDAARQFALGAEHAGIKRIVFLGGLGTSNCFRNTCHASRNISR